MNLLSFCNNESDMKINFKKAIPEYVMEIAYSLESRGYSCFLVGGPVRDIVMGRTPKDYDLSTNATPEQIAQIFPRSVMTGAKFGTVIVLAEDDNKESHSIEVTTFRSEADYVDGRWPTKVVFTSDLRKDLGRRDFTINAMAVNLQALDDDVDENDLEDLFGGMNDVREGKVRAVGTPSERLLEDGLRGFRACRLASSLNFKIEPETFAAIKQSVSIARQVSPERIRDEFLKLLYRSPKPSIGINLMREAGLLEIFLPELLEGIGVSQPDKYHVHDVYDHILATVDAAEDSVKLAALFHDIAKPRCSDGKGHFYQHDVKSSEMAEEIMRRLHFSRSEILRVKNLARWHMFMFGNWREGEIGANWSDSAVRRFIRNVGENNVDDLFKLRIADAISNPKSAFDPREIEALQKRVSEVRAQDMVLSVNDLKISGNDLISLGLTPGPVIGRILDDLLELVTDQPELNNKAELIKLAKNMI